MINFETKSKRKALMLLKHTYIELNQPIGLCTIVSTLHWSGQINSKQSVFLYLLINQQLKIHSITIDTYDRKYAYMFPLEDSESRINWINQQIKLL